jgi:glycogen operon protein
VRRYWRGDAGARGELAGRLAGSADLFDRHGREPSASINFVAAHDGFTLHDLVSYSTRHNEKNGENNADGTAENLSANWGAEGPTDDEAIAALRERVKRAMLATLHVAAGTPMLLAGDEACRTQLGNNNAYCQDNELSWFDWERAATPPARALLAFVERIAALRRRFAMLRSPHFHHGEKVAGSDIEDIAWFGPGGEPMNEQGWHDAEARALTLRRAAAADDGSIDVLAVLFNPTGEPIAFALPTPESRWSMLLDSADPEASEHELDGTRVEVGAHAVTIAHAKIEAPAG